MANDRVQTNKLLEIMDEGLIPSRAIVEMALKYMTEDEVADMMRVNGLSDEDEDEDEAKD